MTSIEVAPVRERGLKYMHNCFITLTYSRSRKGAWIEILFSPHTQSAVIGRSRKGAWIEIRYILLASVLGYVAPVRERGLKFLSAPWLPPPISVAPVRERGLKCICYK